MSAAPLTFTNMIDDAAILSFEHQLSPVNSILGAPRSTSKEKFSPRMSPRWDHPVVSTRIHLLGSAAPGPRSWLWSWANPAGYAEELTGLARALAEFGRVQGIAELSEPEVPFLALPGAPTQPHEVVALMIDAAKVFSGRWFAYDGDAGGGTRVAFLIEHDDFVLPPPEAARILRVIQQSIAELSCSTTDGPSTATPCGAHSPPPSAPTTPDWSLLEPG